MDKITNFLFSPNKSYNYQSKDGSEQQVGGVAVGDKSVYCLENDSMSQMMGNVEDASLLSKEACESKMGDAEAGRLPAFDQWGLDLSPESEGSSSLESARDNLQGNAELDSMQPAKK